MNDSRGTDHEVDVLLVGYFPNDGAIAELFATFASALSRLCRVAVLAPEGADLQVGPEVVRLGFRYDSRRPYQALGPSGIMSHRRAAGLRPVSTLFFTQHPLNIVAAPLFRRSRRVMWWHEPASRGQASRLRSLAYAANDRFVVRQLDGFVVASPIVEQSVPEEFQSRTVVVPFPRPEGFDAASKRFDDDPTDVVFFGKLAPYKGLDVLADALVLLASRGVNPTVRLLGAGHLEEAAPLMSQAATSTAARIEHLDEYASAADVGSALRASSVCVLPYLTAAGSSTIAIAAHHHSCVLASTAGSFGDFLIHDESALLHPPGDAAGLADHIEEALRDGALRRRLSEQLHSVSERRFDRDVVALELHRVLMGDGVDGFGTP